MRNPLRFFTLGLVLLVALALGACREKPPVQNFENNGNGTQIVSVGGPANNNIKSPCAGNSNSASGSSRGDGDEGSQGGGTSGNSGANNPDCSKVETVTPEPLAQTLHGTPSLTAPSVAEMVREAQR